MAPQKRSNILQSLISQRNSAQIRIERIGEKVKQVGTSCSVEELECRLNLAESHFQRALKIQDEIEQIDHAAENTNSDLVRAEIEDLYCDVFSTIKSFIKTHNNEKIETKNEKYSSKLTDNLPKISLPNFSGKYAEFPNFIHLFKTLVHNEPRLTTIEKYNHLRSCLSGAALHAINSLDLTDKNYNIALSLLESRFDNKHLICQEHIKALFQLNKIQKDSAEQLGFLVDKISAHFNSLNSLLTYEEICNAFIVHLAVSALDKESQSKLEDIIDYSKTTTWETCAQTLTQRCQMLQSRESNATRNIDQVRQTKSFNKGSKAVALAAIQGDYCKCCKQTSNHGIWKCPEFQKMEPIQRFNTMKQLSLCSNCFSSNHTVRNCKASSCKKCQGQHHTMLHRIDNKNNSSSSHQTWQQSFSTDQRPSTSSNQQLNPQQQQWQEAPSFIPRSSVVDNSSSKTTMIGQQIQSLTISKNNNSQIILATAIIEIVDRYGNKQLVRALLDSASQLNFMTQDCAQRLNLNKKRVTTVVGGIGQVQTEVKFSTTASILSRATKFEASLQFLILSTITGSQPSCKIDYNSLNIPQNLRLADPHFYLPQKVDVLIGADVFFELFDGKQLKLRENGPTLIHTALGWIVSGRYTTPQRPYSMVSSASVVEQDDELTDLVKEFWSCEQVPAVKRKWSKEQEECEAHFVQNTKRLTNGRFEVRLPFKQNPNSLGDSMQIAFRRFINLEKRITSNIELKSSYVAFLEQYESDGHMTQINFPSSPQTYCILPHHCVIRPDKSTTKCRVVFDASAKTSNNISLNDILMVGPVVQNELVDILWRFRLHEYGLMADITAMYRQIQIHPEDCKMQNILWRVNSSDELKLYRLNTVTYGTAAAPYLATRCLVQLSEENSHTDPISANIIKNDFYVDDLITGGSSLPEINTIKNNIVAILGKACFKLHKWFSNHPEFLSNLSVEERERTIDINNTIVVKTLGIAWNVESDTFKFNYKSTDNFSTCISKRKVLSDLSRLFDPLGFITPIIVKAKIFLQELWLQRLDWDDVIPSDSANAWVAFIKQLDELHTIDIPRYVLSTNSTIQLHGFSDASTRAYGCCFYVRCVDAYGNIKVNLLTSKSKVAPISTIRTLPCLELCGAHLLTKLFTKVSTITSFDACFFWTDSVIVLQWISTHASNFNTFVANRVSFIQEHTADMPWKYVPSKSNPADLVSRGTTVTELDSSIWFTGPDFLIMSPDNWPQKPTPLATNILPELKIQRSVLLTVTNNFIEFINSHSNFKKLCTVFAYVRRFIQNCRNKSNQITSSTITAIEFENAFSNIIFIIQQFYFAKDIRDLQNIKQVSQSSILKTLNPFLESDGSFTLLKVGGRLKNASLPYEVKCPILLPKGIAFVDTYIRHLHLTNCHAGAQALLHLVRQKFWIIGAREYVRRIVRKCVLCFKYRPKLLSQIMGDLPKNRVEPINPFTHCGVDFFGPIMTTIRIRSKPKIKSYVAVFICFVTKAVHMEVVSSLTTDAFIAALKRFIGRRGLCTTLYCDNATNFVGARNMLKEFKNVFTNDQTQDAITKWCSSQNINFKHIPPRSPHFGGIWEAAVKSAKSLLLRSMQSALFTYEELTTLIIQIESILNSRPITAMSSDPSDEQALTPAHFLNIAPMECFIEPRYTQTKIHYLKTWQQISSIQQHFWNRWSKEYLVLLQQRNKWTHNVENVNVGALVLVHEDNLPPQNWLIGRVTAVFPGADRKVRVADVKTRHGTLRRSITKLAVLPVETA